MNNKPQEKQLLLCNLMINLPHILVPTTLHIHLHIYRQPLYTKISR